MNVSVDLYENETPKFWHSILIFVDPNYIDLLPLFNEMPNAVLDDIERKVIDKLAEGRTA